MRRKFLFLLLLFVVNFVNVFAQGEVIFKIATLNCEWLSCNQNGPSNDAKQIDNIAIVLNYVDADIYALQEIGTSGSFKTLDTLVKKMGSNIWACNISTNDATNCGQNQGIIYKKAKFQFLNSTQMTEAGTSYNFASRYPALYNMNFIVGSEIVPVSIINLHMKAMGDETSYARRKAASTSLKTLLDGSSWNSKNVIIIGDLNDYLIGTQCNSCGGISPYKNFMDDQINWKGCTSNLVSLYYSPKPVIDNIIISDELFNNFVSNSAYQDENSTYQVNNYESTTTDHVAISIELRFPGNNVANTDIIPENNNISVYPNPVTTELQITNYELQNGETIEIYDITGKLLITYNISHITTIDVSYLQSGTYFLKIGNQIKKFIKN